MILSKHELIVFDEFTRDYHAGLTGTLISRKRKLNQKTVSNILKRAEDLGLMTSATDGKNKKYFLNIKDRETAINFISSIEHEKAISFYKKNPLVKEIAEKAIPFCKGIVLVFGSYAKGTETKESDLDLLIAGRCDESQIRELSEMYRLEISAHVYPENAKLAGPLFEEAKKDHILILNAEQFIRRILYGKDHVVHEP